MVDCWNSELTVTYMYLSGTGDGSVSKTFALQVQGPELDSHSPHKGASHSGVPWGLENQG